MALRLWIGANVIRSIPLRALQNANAMQTKNRRGYTFIFPSWLSSNVLSNESFAKSGTFTLVSVKLGLGISED